MSDTAGEKPRSEHVERFIRMARECLDGGTLVKLTLGKYRGKAGGLKHVYARPLAVRGEACLSFVYRYQTRDITKNAPVADALVTLRELLETDFNSGHIFSTTGDTQMVFGKRGKCTWGHGKPSCSQAGTVSHNREKERMLDVAEPFLQALGITDQKHRVRPSMSRKWKQVNKFLEVFEHAFSTSGLSEASPVHVVDFGCGKGYLTFAVHQFLRQQVGIDARVTGVELRKDLVEACADVAGALAMETMGFLHGDLRSCSFDELHVLIALHACDTATDEALHLGIRSGARIIMCAPCCHKQIRPQLKVPEVLRPVLRFGIHLGQEAEMVTDALRALHLEAAGYRVQLFEFVSLDHTSKNKMLLAVKHDGAVDRTAIQCRIDELKSFYGIREHALEALLAG